jgi:hypothetical protein
VRQAQQHTIRSAARPSLTATVRLGVLLVPLLLDDQAPPLPQHKQNRINQQLESERRACGEELDGATGLRENDLVDRTLRPQR